MLWSAYITEYPEALYNIKNYMYVCIKHNLKNFS